MNKYQTLSNLSLTLLGTDLRTDSVVPINTKVH